MAVSLEQFSRQLAESGVLSEADLRAFLDKLPAAEKPADGEQLAKRLVKEKKISAYQAQVVYSGKGKTLTMGSYFILDKLGQGGMGMVLKAEHRMMKRLVAIKVLSPSVTKTKELAQRFQREVEAAARLTHPNIVGAFDAGETNGSPFLVMEYVPGDDLSSIVKKKGPLSVDQAIDCIAQTAKGLEFAHSQGVIHRDIKPANLLMDTTGVVKILDMGLARIESTDVATQADLTGTGAVMGTVDYMAPEQALSTKHADARSDLYSLGISLWYLLTGKPAYEGDSLMARLLAHREQPIPSLHAIRGDVPESLEHVFQKLVAKKQADRYQTAMELLVDLQACRTGASIKAVTVAEVATGPDEFQNFLQQIDSPTEGPRGSQLNPSITSTKTLSRTRPSTKTIVQSNISDTLSPGARKRNRQTSQAGPWYQNAKVLVGGAGVAVLLAVILLFSSSNGTLRVEILDPEVEVVVQGTGITLKGKDSAPVRVKAGEHKLIVTRGDLSFETDRFTMKRGTETRLKVELVDDRLLATSGKSILGERLIKQKTLTTSTTTSPARGTNVSGANASRSTAPDSPSPPGKRWALEFAVPDNLVEMEPMTRLDTTECTVELWVTPTAVPVRDVKIAQNIQGGIILNPNSTFAFYTFHGGAFSEPVLQLNKRIHLAGVNDTRRRLLFLNGRLIASDNDPGVVTPDGTSVPMDIGGIDFRGLIETVRFSRVARYSKDFTPPLTFTSDRDTTALYLFKEGQGDVLKDSSGNNRHGKIKGARWVQVEGTSISTPQGAGDVIDVLAQIDLARDTVKHPTLGEWRREGDALISPGGGKSGRLALPIRPPAEYELTAVVERLAGSDGIMFGAVVDGHPVSVCFDTYIPHVSGINMIDGKPHPENESKFGTPILGDFKRHTVRIVVGNRSIRATVDDKPIIDWEGDPRRLTCPEVSNRSQNIWFGAAYHQFKFHKLELRTLNVTESPSGDAATDVVFLDDVKETAWKNGHLQLGKHNREYNGWKYVWRGKEPAHALVTHPRTDMTASVSYPLDGRYDSFSSTIGLADATETGSQSPLTFRVVGDGKELWRSRPVQAVKDEESFSVSVKGIRELLLEVSCAGDNYKAFAVWFEPRLTLAGAPAKSIAHLLASPDYEWTKPENLGPIINAIPFNEHPELTPDGLKMWFSGGGELWTSSRKSLDAPWQRRVNAGSQINDNASWDSEPTLSADGLTLVFCSDRGTGKKDQNLWMCIRSRVSEPFGRPVQLGGEINSSEWETCPALSADGLTLMFTSARSGGIGSFDLWQATRANFSAEFGNVRNLGPSINSPVRDSGAHLASDGLTLLFESSRTGGRTDLYFCTRPMQDAPFGTPVSLGPVINTEHDEQAPCLSNDGQTLMFYSNRPGGHGQADIWVSRRVPKNAALDPKLNIPAEALAFGGHRYLLVESFGTWSEAKAGAEKMGGHLVTINSRGERDWILENMWRKRPQLQDVGCRMFLGGINVDGTWKWVTKEPLDPSLFLGQVDNLPDYGLAWNSETSWGFVKPDDVNSRYFYFVVEWDTDGERK